LAAKFKNDYQDKLSRYVGTLRGERTRVWARSDYETTKTAAQIFQDIIFPLLQKRGTLIALATPESVLDGSYVLASFEPSRIGARPRWTYTMRLIMGGGYVIL
jgi:hypothetical protein